MNRRSFIAGVAASLGIAVMAPPTFGLPQRARTKTLFWVCDDEWNVTLGPVEMNGGDLRFTAVPVGTRGRYMVIDPPSEFWSDMPEPLRRGPITTDLKSIGEDFVSAGGDVHFCWPEERAFA